MLSRAGRAEPASLQRRAALALALMAGFYALSAALLVGLVWLPWTEWTSGRFSLAGAAMALAGARVAWALIPRRRRFEAPGPVLDEQAAPELHALVGDLARELKQPVPATLYLLPSVNAFVGRGDGIHPERIMGLGFPLLGLLDRAELRAVIAHELGHEHAGDTRLGPWVHRTRSALGGALSRLEGDGSGLLHLPFAWYGRLFGRITLAVSREQELHADAVSARLAGPGAAMGALERVHHDGGAWHAYWHGEVMPLVEHGRFPPLVEGFRIFLQGDGVQRALAAGAEEARTARADSWDTHPSLLERKEAIACLDAEERPDPRSALSLLPSVPAIEELLVRAMFRHPDHARLEPMRWEESGPVWLEIWRQQLQGSEEAFRGLDPSRLGEVMKDLDGFSARMHARLLGFYSPEARRRRGTAWMAMWLALACDAQGGRAETLPGHAVRFWKGAMCIEPWVVIDQLRKGELSSEAWETRWAVFLRTPADPEPEPEPVPEGGPAGPGAPEVTGE